MVIPFSSIDGPSPCNDAWATIGSLSGETPLAGDPDAVEPSIAPSRNKQALRREEMEQREEVDNCRRVALQ